MSVLIHILLPGLLAFGAVPASTPVEEQPIEHALRSVEVARIRASMQVLAHDSLEGRGTGTRGERRAAAWIAAQLQAAGVTPAGDGGSWRQRFPVHCSVPLPGSTLSIVFDDSTAELAVQRDVVLFETGAQTFVPQPLPLVFAGYGIVAPEYDYNDYQGLDVRNSIVVFLSGEPPSHDTAYFAGNRATVHANPAWKQRIALSRGARGSILITRAADAVRPWHERLSEFAFEYVTPASAIPSILSVEISPERAGVLFRGAPYSLRDVVHMDSTGSMRGFPLAGGAAYRGEFRTRDARAANIVGLIEGEDPLLRDSYLVLAAHYDGLGTGPAHAGDSIYNGAVDNAIGCATLLELARVLAAMRPRPARSILVLFVTGEEKGLLGSTWYTAHPVRPLHRTVAAINIDGLAMFEPMRAVTGIGAELSTLGTLLERAAARVSLEVQPVPAPFSAEESFLRSDQLAFAMAGIPSMLVMESLDYVLTSREEGLRRFLDWNARIYHSPMDDMRQPLDHAAMTQHARLLLALALEIAGAREEPRWYPGTRFLGARLRSAAEGT